MMRMRHHRAPRRVWAIAVSWVLMAGLATGAAAASADNVAGADIIGEVRHFMLSGEETLLDVARRHNLGFIELRSANPDIDPWLPPAGQTILLPSAHILPDAPRKGIVINLADFRLYYFPPEGSPPLSWPIGIGEQGRSTPLGVTRIAGKRENPRWIPTADARKRDPALPAVVPAGPQNPLGDRALDLAWDEYVIHGTNRPYGIGRRVSSGCIRLYPEDIRRLFEIASVGTPVTIVNQPVKVGRRGAAIYVEAHPSTSQAHEIEEFGDFTPEEAPDITDALMRAAGTTALPLDWERLTTVLAERRGFPVRVTR